MFCGNQEAYDIFGTVSGLLCAVTAPAAMGIKGVQGIGGVTSYARAIGTQYAKAAISAGAGYLGNEAGEAMGLPKWASFLMGVGVGTAAGFGTEALDRTFNISGYHINSYGELMTPEDAASYNQYWDEVESGKHLPPGLTEGGSKADVLANNRIQGAAFEKQEFAKFSANTTDAVEQVTIKTTSGVKTRVDAIGLDSNGKVVINEFKSSATATLTDNQKIAFPEIFSNGGTVVGNGKGIFTEGYQIPAGTEVKIVRPGFK